MPTSNKTVQNMMPMGKPGLKQPIQRPPSGIRNGYVPVPNPLPAKMFIPGTKLGLGM